MLTDDDVKKLKTVFVSKEELKNDVQRLDHKTDRIADMLVQTREEMHQMESRLSKQAQENTDRILDVMDTFAGEIKDHRMKEVIHQNQHDKIVERLDKIEKIPVIAHELKN